MERVTHKDLTQAFRLFTQAAARCGFPGTKDWILEEGSETYGRAYRVFRRDPETGGYLAHRIPGTSGIGYIGMTARDAYIALNAARSAMYEMYLLGT